MEKREIYPDLLRILAICAIIVLHVASRNMWLYDVGDFQFEVFTLWYSLTRWAVPIFIMISGAFLLDEKKSISNNKLFAYCKRILISFVGWSLVYAIWNTIISYDFVWPNFNLSALWQNFYMGPYHFWYLYVILGLYLILPFLRKCVAQCNKKDIEYLLLLFFVFSIFAPILTKFDVLPFLTYWINSMRISSVSGYIGLFVLGYYLRKYNEMFKLKRWVCMITFFIALILMIFLTFYLEIKTGVRDDFWQDNLSIFVVIQAISLFVLCMKNEKSLIARKERTKNAISYLSKNSFGVYLCHDIFISLFARIGLDTAKYNPIWGVGVISALVTVASYIFIGMLKKVWSICKIIFRKNK